MRLRAAIAIDLGTVNTLIAVAGRGIVVDEPSAIALNTATGAVVALGQAADTLTGKEPRDIEVVHPLQDGVIADLGAATAMLQGFVKRARLRRGLLRAATVICVPGGATWVERRSLAAAVTALRPRCTAQIIEEPVAAAAGAGFDLSTGSGAFIMDVGGGTTEIAVLAGRSVVRAQSLRMAGNAMDQAIAQAVRTELRMLIGRDDARSLKAAIGLIADGPGPGGPDRPVGPVESVGVDIASRAPRAVTVPAPLVAAALERPVAAITAATQEMLSDIPPSLAADVVRGKIRIAGGGALLPGLASQIEAVTGIPAMVADDPLRCVVRGAAEILEQDSGS